MDPASFRSSRLSFIEELQYQITNPTFDYKDKPNISWLQLHNFPDKVSLTLRKLSTQISASKSAGFQSAVRCAISMGLYDIHQMESMTLINRLETFFNHLPQVGEPCELFIGQFFSTRLVTEFSGVRYNLPVTDEMKRDIMAVSAAYSIALCDVVTLACIFALLRDDNPIPQKYRAEWSASILSLEGLAKMKAQGALSMIRTLPGGEGFNPIVHQGLSEKGVNEAGFSPDSPMASKDYKREDGYDDWN